MSTPLVLPVLEDPPLRLRAFTAKDAPVVIEAGTDPLIPLITTVAAAGDHAAALAFITGQHQRAATGAGYSFAIAETATDRAVGQVGLWPLPHGRASVGYWTAPSARRRGIAGHALRIISSWALTLPGIERVELYVEPWNEGSWRAAEQAGYQREGLLRSWQHVGAQRRDMLVYSRLPPEPAD